MESFVLFSGGDYTLCSVDAIKIHKSKHSQSENTLAVLVFFKIKTTPTSPTLNKVAKKKICFLHLDRKKNSGY